MSIWLYLGLFGIFLGVLFVIRACRVAGQYDVESDELYAELVREEELKDD